MTNYMITAKNMDMLEEAVQYVKTLLDAIDVRYIDSVAKFREPGYFIMHRINIKYHSPILFSILDSGTEDIIDFDEGRINLFRLSIKEEHQYIYDYKGYNTPGATLYDYVRTYLDNEHIEYHTHALIQRWREIANRGIEYKRLLNNIYGRGGLGNLAPIVLINEVVQKISEDARKYKEKIEMNRRFEIKKVIFNNPATIVIWANGAKTVVKAQNEIYDPEKGLAMAFAKRALGGKGSYYDVFKQWLPNEKVDFNDFEKFEKAVQKEAEHELKTYLGKQDK